MATSKHMLTLSEYGCLQMYAPVLRDSEYPGGKNTALYRWFTQWLHTLQCRLSCANVTKITFNPPHQNMSMNTNNYSYNNSVQQWKHRCCQRRQRAQAWKSTLWSKRYIRYTSNVSDLCSYLPLASISFSENNICQTCQLAVHLMKRWNIAAVSSRCLAAVGWSDQSMRGKKANI